MAVTNPESSTMLDYVLGYLQRGLPIFPVCTPSGPGRCLQHGRCQDGGKPRAGKVPLIPWKALQTRLPDELDIRDWWDRWPTANIGMATGALSGIVALDADGQDARREAMTRGVPNTPSVWTGQPGGCHFHLKHPGADVRNFARKLPGLDFRGDGGYVLLPPSLHASGANYRWVDGTESAPLAPIPEWLCDLISGDGPDGEPEERTSFDLNAVLRGAPEGQRDDLLFRYACKLREDDVSQAYADIFVRQAARACRPPFDEDLAAEKVRRAYREYQPSPRLEVPPEGLREEGAEAEAGDPFAGSARPETSPYPIMNLAELVLLANDTLESIVDGIVWGNRLHWFFSQPGVGKTLFLVALGMHVAAGREFCGRKVKQGPVLFIEEDSPLSLLAEYVQMVTDIYEFDLEALPFWVNKIQGLRLTNAEGVAMAWGAVEACPEFPTLLFLDTSERIAPSEKFSTKELEFLARFLQEYIGRGGTPGVIDHTKRPQMLKGKFIEPNDPMELLYGARAKQAISDVMLYFSGALKTGEVAIKYAKFRGETPPDVNVRFDPELGFKVKPELRTTRTPVEQEVVKWLNNHNPGAWWLLTEIIAGAGVAERSGKRAIANLKRRGWIERDDSPKKLGARYRVDTTVAGEVFSD